MDEEEKQQFIEAGKITSKALDYGVSLVKKGNSILETVELVEKKIHSLGAIPAFPVQISCDSTAAHFCPEIDDKTIFSDQVVSLDVGVCYQGAIGDSAYTIDLSGEHKQIVLAAQHALSEALKVVDVGVPIGKIGKAIEDAILGYGLRPIRNLSGHGVSKFEVHTDPSIPNYDTHDKTPLKKGQVIAIEPFATNGSGSIHEVGNPTVFMLTQKRPVRNQITREVLREIERYNGLPFCRRWLVSKFGQKTNFALREMDSLGMLDSFPPLVEVNKGIVAQAEHTVLLDDGPIVITKI